MAFTEIEIRGLYLKEDGETPAVGSVQFILSATLQDPATNEIVAPVKQKVTLVDGVLETTLVATDDTGIVPENATYQVTEKISGAAKRVYNIEVPNNAPGGILQLADVAPVEDGPLVITYALAADLNAHVADTTAAHAATAISVTPFSTIAATNVQTALEEMLTEAAGGVTDHGMLTGLADDDHTQYHTNARGDARYPLIADLTAEATARANADTALQTEIDTEETARATHAALTTGAHGGIVASNDARLTDARTPTAHATTHVTGGADVIASAVASGNAGLMTGTDKAKLDGVASGATANATNAQLRDRATHTGTQTASTISDFDTQVRTSRLDQMAAPTASVAMNAQKITGVLDPTLDQDAATKKYVDDEVAGAGGGVTDHGALTGLADNDHPQYALDSALTAHTGDTSDAHDASAVSFAPAGAVAATDVQAAIEEVSGDVTTVSTGLSDHLVDATAAHAATAISVAPFSTIAATTVQAALEEIVSEAGGGGAPTTSEYLTTASDGTLSAEVVIPGLAGWADVLGAAGGTISEEYDSSTHGLTASPSSPATLDSDTTVKSHLFGRTTDTTARYLYRAFAPGAGVAFDARAKVAIGLDGAVNNASLGLAITDGSPGSNILEANFNIWTSVTPVPGLSGYSGSGFSGVGTSRVMPGNQIYLRITRTTGNVYSIYWSVSGQPGTWVLHGSTAAIATTVVSIGYRFGNAAATPFSFTCDWLRVITGSIGV